MSFSLNNILAHPITNVVSIDQNKNTNIKKTADIAHQKEKSVKNKNKKVNSEQEHVKNANKYLDIKIIRQMLTRFLAKKQMPKEILADELGVTVEELEQLFAHTVSLELIHKVNLPLIKLYCETRWL